MSRQEISDEEIKADLMYRLLRKHCWGAKYLPLDTLINWMSKQIIRDGRRVRRCVEDLTKEGYILLHKRGKAISLNPTRSREILEYIKRVLEI
ncbi:MAG: hypothetical protein MRT15_03445 [archaeon YNP-LCB-003-016]|jgi:hypothetical protein|uniref:hypothetical protein n=1 Tax=Candidatus Culexarchaeum yellowstonense TaxID=2928963 RepID=UPI0026ED4D25|nr:hypothetical protein [Candidatus Culexarchaeum yellowstonense]MCR6691421.1 hypothetical protein [Candidatus Culexarchaeum yellowstonense]